MLYVFQTKKQRHTHIVTSKDQSEKGTGRSPENANKIFLQRKETKNFLAVSGCGGNGAILLEHCLSRVCHYSRTYSHKSFDEHM